MNVRDLNPMGLFNTTTLPFSSTIDSQKKSESEAVGAKSATTSKTQSLATYFFDFAKYAFKTLDKSSLDLKSKLNKKKEEIADCKNLQGLITTLQTPTGLDLNVLPDDSDAIRTKKKEATTLLNKAKAFNLDIDSSTLSYSVDDTTKLVEKLETHSKSLREQSKTFSKKLKTISALTNAIEKALFQFAELEKSIIKRFCEGMQKGHS
jgi:hypothetical protein